MTAKPKDETVPIKLYHAPIDELTMEERTGLLELSMRLDNWARKFGVKVVMVALPPDPAGRERRRKAEEALR